MNFTPQESAWLYGWFRDHRKGMPSARSFQPYYNATSWDLQDLFRAFREEALEHPTEVSSIVSALTTGHKWPRLKTKDAFWIEARWGEVEAHCMSVSGMRSLAIPASATPPKDAPAAIGWLLQEAWETRFVDSWIRDNARWYVSVDDPSIQESVTDLEIFLRKLEGKR
jgi:hypothetical protein